MRASFGCLVVGVAALLNLGCGHCAATSTTGTTYRCEQFESPWVQAARVSAVQDLSCAAEKITIKPIGHGKYPASDYLADGCGKRASYNCEPASLSQTCTMVLVSKFEIH